jgi:tetratricopeptide (TPR) repeat protein
MDGGNPVAGLTALQTFSSRTLGVRVDVLVLQENFVRTRSEVESDAAALARTVRQRSGSEAFLKRAAMLHTDTLIFSGRFPRPPDDAPRPVPRTERERARAVDTPPLLYNEGISLARDGLGGIPSANQTNGEAERLYRRTLAVDPSYVEARVRLARLLERRGQYKEADEQITVALDARPSGVPLFFAHLIAGRIASVRGRYEDALRHYRAASGLNAGAQSALLGASHAALMLADVREALGPLEQLAGSAARSEGDPWLDYEFGAGRDADALLTAVRSRVPK